MYIKGKKVTLRAIEEKDLPLLHKWANDPYTQDIMGDIHPPSSMDFHQEWFKKLKNDNWNLRLAIDTPDLGIIGLTTIINIDWRNNHAWHGIMLGDADIRGKGYGQDTLMTTMKYAFDELHMERLDGQIIEYNQVPYNLYCGKCGWREEGRKKNYWFRKGRYWDSIVLGITKDEYRENLLKTKYWDDEKKL